MFRHGRPSMLLLMLLSLCIVVSVTNAGRSTPGQFHNELASPAPLPEEGGVQHLNYVVRKGGGGGGGRGGGGFRGGSSRGGSDGRGSGCPGCTYGYGGRGHGHSGAAMKFGRPSGHLTTLGFVMLLGGLVS
ncbi:hypothetical protein LINGRAHAP2_LOCUS29917, partial [Linum grandiflorum]